MVVVDGAERRVRLLGVDTPETVHPNKPVQFYGKEASNFTKESLTGKSVWLEYDSNPQEFFIFFPDDWHIAKVENDTGNQQIRVIVIKVDYVE